MSKNLIELMKNLNKSQTSKSKDNKEYYVNYNMKRLQSSVKVNSLFNQDLKLSNYKQSKIRRFKETDFIIHVTKWMSPKRIKLKRSKSFLSKKSKIDDYSESNIKLLYS